MKAARIWAAVSRNPPIRIDFLGPNFLYRMLGTIPTSTEAFTAKENYKDILGYTHKMNEVKKGRFQNKMDLPS